MYLGRSHISLRSFDDDYFEGSKVASYKVPARRKKYHFLIIGAVFACACALAGLIYVIVINSEPATKSDNPAVIGAQTGTDKSVVDGGFRDWGEWGLCSVSCGGGGRHRNRSCDNPAPANGGKDCVGLKIETETCNLVDCPTDAGFGSWGVWSECSVSCGGGERTRSRLCDNSALNLKASNCVGEFNQTETCSNSPCPVDGGLGDWSTWSTCSATCGTGVTQRRRECNNPTPAYGGNYCTGTTSEAQTCTVQPCDADGGFGSWSAWTECSVSCGGGDRTRDRLCDNPSPVGSGNICTGDYNQTERCAENDCPVNGGYSDWSAWGQCSVTCGSGGRHRNRSCDNPPPAFGGQDCSGAKIDTEICNTQTCPVNGGFGTWGTWGVCSATCGGGERSRYRQCINPSPADGGNNCTGDFNQTETCNNQPCPANGGFGSWGEWGDCSVTCGGGDRLRNRSCDNPPPAHGGQDCTGPYNETGSCNNQACPVDGGYGSWSAWTICSVTCGMGTRSRNRLCDSPPPAHGGTCGGEDTQTESCMSQSCPVDGGFGSWNTWGECTATCGGGSRIRNRSCDNPTPAYGGHNCSGDFFEMGTCNDQPCPVDGGFGPWGFWGECSVSCGGGQRMRHRACDNPTPLYGGINCSGDYSQTESCSEESCPVPVDGGFSSWGDWSACSTTCGLGQMTRHRSCDNPSPADGGLNCVGEHNQTESCVVQSCPDDVEFGPWSSWGDCSVTCGGGARSRNRSCDNPAPGETNCTGAMTQEERCNDQPCPVPVDGGFSSWGDWSACSTTCGLGQMTRHRSCDNPSPADGGLDCLGDHNQTESCVVQSCPVDGGFGQWGSWGTCTVTCGGGARTRNRSCDSPQPAHGGHDCEGENSQTESCNSQPCPIDGGFSFWSPWGSCSMTCEGGQRSRNRTCDNPTPAHGGNDCSGESIETETCNSHSCSGPVDGGFSFWSVWSTCSVMCGGGERTRNRTCDNPRPANGGNDCVGDFEETETCNEQSCPVDGGYSVWSVWGTCSVTCGGGERIRNRTCDNPAPAHGGQDCVGENSQSEMCHDQPCPVDGGFSLWGAWGTCSVTCGGGERTRNRTCDNPPPAHGGNDCVGGYGQTESCNDQSCPVDGGFSTWSSWGTCSVTCGGGERSRNRSCDNPLPENGGNDCVGDVNESETCNDQLCPIDGGFSDWGTWSICSVTCGGGERSRNRSCDNPPPAHGGNDCVGEYNETETCNDQLCPVHGGFSEWSAWGTCSVSCGGGERSRNRTCDNPTPAHGGNDCVGEQNETENCNEQSCPVDGGFSNWSNWGTCSVTCGGGERSRNRSCDSPLPANGGNDCVGDVNETETCNDQPCPIDGGFSDWSNWGTCSVTCGSGGERSRNRACNNPLPAHGGNVCVGEYNETEPCNDQPCPVDGGFGFWSSWGTCSVSCGGGERTRNRSCDNPVPAHGGSDCVGEYNETETCNDQPCPIDGGLGFWSDWGTCSVTCGGGERTRNRSCDNPPPAHGGNDCIGALNETESCNDQPCPIDGGFSIWSSWGTCSLTCGSGERTRNRSCDNPAPAHGGSDCVGDYNETETCNDQPCPIDGGFSLWSSWGTCSATCGAGERTRNRSCDNPTPAHGGSDCVGEYNQTETCNDQPCPIDGGFSLWSSWGTCSATCGAGERTRNRSCDNPTPAHGGSDCVGEYNQTETCNDQPCPIDGEFSDWSVWGTCSVTCGGGERIRNRSCDNPVPAHGGNDCVGEYNETEACNSQPCPVDGGFSLWGEWGTCSVTCGGGERTRNRSCDNPPPAHGGNDCVGEYNETENCNDQPCPVDGGFGPWSEWGECSVTCGGGVRMRNRSCDTPVPAHGGNDCVGDFNETETCNIGDCFGPCGQAPRIRNFSPLENISSDSIAYYACESTSDSVDIDSGNRKCPSVTCRADNTWSSFKGTCGNDRTYGSEIPGVGGTFIGSSGAIRSPLYPAQYPDDNAFYYWTLLTTGTSIDFTFSSLDLVGDPPICFISVSVYCGMNIASNNPTHGPFCGSTVPSSFTCPTSCALVRFSTITQGETRSGFELLWTSVP